MQRYYIFNVVDVILVIIKYDKNISPHHDAKVQSPEYLADLC